MDQYMQLLKEQMPLYLNLNLEIGKQETAIVAEEYAALNQVLLQKDALIKQIDELEQKAVLLRNEFMRRHSLVKFDSTELGAVYPAGELAPLKDVMAERESLIQRMLIKEKRNEETLRGKMDEVEEGMRQLQVGKQVNNAYQSLDTAFASSAFMDKKQ